METIILSLGGSIIIPEEIDTNFLQSFKELILKHENNRFVIVCGGGKLCRKYRDAAKKIMLPQEANSEDLDWIGVRATWVNAELIKTIFSGIVYENIITNPTKAFDTDKRIIVAGGWKPGWSTDTDAVYLAKMLNAKTIINLSNIEKAYDKDPNKFQDAKPIEECSWAEFRKIVGDEWSPGANFPFDPVASKLAEENNFKVIIAKGTDLQNLDKILCGKEFEGTVIK